MLGPNYMSEAIIFENMGASGLGMLGPSYMSEIIIYHFLILDSWAI